MGCKGREGREGCLCMFLFVCYGSLILGEVCGWTLTIDPVGKVNPALLHRAHHDLSSPPL